MPYYLDSKIITLNSAYALPNNKTMLSNVLFKTGVIYEENSNIIETHISLINAQIPVSFYIVNINNNQFRLSINSSSYVSYFIPYGNYNNYSLINALQTLLGSSFTFTFSSINGGLTIASTNLIFSLDFTVSSCNILLGFDKSFYNITSGSIISPYPLNLLGVKRISIKSYNLGIQNYNSTGGDITLSTIPCDQPPFNMISYTNQYITKQHINIKMINAIDLLIMDETNTLLDFNNINWTITLLLEFNIFKPDVAMSFNEILKNKPIETHTIEDIKDETLGKDIDELEFLNE